jgi:hypothetical protein
MAQTLQPEERIYLKGKQFLLERLRVRDLDFEELLEDDDVVAQKKAAEAEALQQQQQQQAEMVKAQIEKLVSEAIENLAQAKAAGVAGDVKVFESITGAVKNAADIDKERTRDKSGAGSASKPRRSGSKAPA